MKIAAWIAALFLLAGRLAAAAPSPAPLLQFRIVVAEGAPDADRTTLARATSEGTVVDEVLFLSKGAVLTESSVASARMQPDPIQNRPQVGIVFTPEGKRHFAELTRTNLNKRLAIVVDGKAIAAPVLRTEIRDGQAVIDGNFTREEASELARKINRAVQPEAKDKTRPWTNGPYDSRVPVQSPRR